MPPIGPRYTGLCLGGFTGPELVPEFDPLDASDTWSVSTAESPASRVPIDPKACADTWTLSVDDETRRGQILDLPWWYTDVGPLLVSASPGAFAGSAAPNVLPVTPSDTWSLSWQEGPVDTLLADAWDSMLLALSESVSMRVTQDYPATEYWWMTLSEVSQLSVTSSQLDLSVSDSCSLRLTPEAASMFKDLPTTDSWSAAFSLEASALLNLADVSDDWAATVTEDPGDLVEAGVFEVDANESWSLQCVDSTALMRTLYPSPSDSWAIRYTPESAAVITSGAMQLSDDWNLKADDSTDADLQMTPMFTDLDDSWGVMLQSEIAEVSTIPAIMVIAVDQLTLSCTDSCFVSKGHVRPPAHRRIKISRRRTPVTVDE